MKGLSKSLLALGMGLLVFSNAQATDCATYISAIVDSRISLKTNSNGTKSIKSSETYLRFNQSVIPPLDKDDNSQVILWLSTGTTGSYFTYPTSVGGPSGEYFSVTSLSGGGCYNQSVSTPPSGPAIKWTFLTDTGATCTINVGMQEVYDVSTCD